VLYASPYDSHRSFSLAVSFYCFGQMVLSLGHFHESVRVFQLYGQLMATLGYFLLFGFWSCILRHNSTQVLFHSIISLDWNDEECLYLFSVIVAIFGSIVLVTISWKMTSFTNLETFCDLFYAPASLLAYYSMLSLYLQSSDPQSPLDSYYVGLGFSKFD
jgi:hypothetical protein